MMKKLIEKYGKDKINTLTKYPSILTLHCLGEKGRLTDQLTTCLSGEQLFATEKIDGTNARIVCFGSEYLVGAREFILHHSDDLYFDNAQGIVEGLRVLGVNPPETDTLTVIYGEFYGGKASSGSKNYGQEKNGFRVFDIAILEDLSVLDRSLAEISSWRERETADGIIYGQKFLKREEMMSEFSQFEYAPSVEFDLGGCSHESVLENLRKYLPETRVALTDTAQMKAEGVVLRNADRSKIVKVRFEDYERTLRSK